jgi:diadenylate cyclase
VGENVHGSKEGAPLAADDLDIRLRMLRLVAPGSQLREGLESVLRARTGALIVVGDTPDVLALMDGGFRLDVPFVASYLYELAKMDGAIVLNRDASRILYANTLLVPQASIPSFETGIRHRTAERVAKQTGELVIAISQRRNVISLYKGPVKYVLRETTDILAKANEALATLARYRQLYDEALHTLSILELQGEATVGDVVAVIARAATIARIVKLIDAYVAELGTEGRLVAMQLRELTASLEVVDLVLRDYLPEGLVNRAGELRASFADWDADSPDATAVARALGLPTAMETKLQPRGYRLLCRVPRLPMPVVENLVAAFGSLENVQRASIEDLDEVDGIGEMRARVIQETLRRLREHAYAERHL